MGVVWITCPTKGERVSTGIETDQESLDAIPSWAAQYPCPACGEVHVWADVKAELVEEPPPPVPPPFLQ